MNKGLFSSNSGEWETPQWLFDELDKEFGFNLDPCCTHENCKTLLGYTKQEDGLSRDWAGSRVFMNPPYGREIGKWIKKAFESEAEVVVGLLPARTDTKWFWDYIYKKKNVEIRFIKGRLKFGGSKNSAPFPSLIAIFRNIAFKPHIRPKRGL